MLPKCSLRRTLAFSAAALTLILSGCYSSSESSSSTGSDVVPLAVSSAGMQAALGELQQRGARMDRHGKTGQLTFIGADPLAPLALPAAVSGLKGDDPAQAALERYAPLFGARGTGQAMQLLKRQDGKDGRSTSRYQQLYQGLPVIGGELLVNLRGRGLLAMSGELSPDLSLSVTPMLSASVAQSTALQATAKWRKLAPEKLEASDPVLSIYDPRLLGPGQEPTRLVYRLEVSARGSEPVRELVLVDARSGNVALHFNQIDAALSRQTYTASNTETLPGSLICDEGNPSCANGDLDAQLAHRYARDTYDFYFNTHQRDSLDNKGMALLSSTHYGAVGYQNAFWDGRQIAYGDGFSRADDVVGHELTHGVTQHSSKLFYYYQSGAINESLSDIWGEFIDQRNNSGTDTAAVKWQIGEDIPGIGAIRDMADPTRFGDPDRMSSPNYDFDKGFQDNGGVHHNSGINNKAAYLMVEGGSFNGRTITGLGIDKVAKIYYEAQTRLLTSGATYKDLANALYQGCLNLSADAGSGINGAECDMVRQATEAVEMQAEPVNSFQPQPDPCPAGSQPRDLFSDDLESPTLRWTVSTLNGSQASWRLDTQNVSSGKQALWGKGMSSVADDIAVMPSAVMLPANAFLHFRHSYDFEADGEADIYYDGGVLEYSVNNGANWQDAASLFADGGNYSDKLDGHYGNTLAGHSAFVGRSHGYIASLYNLSSLAGQSVRFRFRIATDDRVASDGWWVDDVRIYTCLADVDNQAPLANAGPDLIAAPGATVSLDGSGSKDPEGQRISLAWQVISGSASLTGANTAVPSFVAPLNGRVVARLTVTDSQGKSASDDVTVTVSNTAPELASIGARQAVLGQPLNFQVSARDANTDTVTLSATGLPSGARFDAATGQFSWPQAGPLGNYTVTFTATDAGGLRDSENVTINVLDMTSISSSAQSQGSPAPSSSAMGGGGGLDAGALTLLMAGLGAAQWQRRKQKK
ncbi:M4 family metallopeptidase [Thermithiobacillus plumbiphilus]|uniref:M4 family metallopeptidase n=1 Tax=Thermithiobacillus plumbiphilus TaxID=1729899 RepID=A0ABU9DB63_9PROT